MHSSTADLNDKLESAAASKKGTRNFFLFGTSGEIDDVLEDLTKKLNDTFFSDQFKWYSFSFVSFRNTKNLTGLISLGLTSKSKPRHAAVT